MARTHTWEISDEFWALVEPLIPTPEELRETTNQVYQRKIGAGRKRKYDNRTCFAAIIYILRNGRIWNALPREKFGGLGSSALRERFQLWARVGLFAPLECRIMQIRRTDGNRWETASGERTPNQSQCFFAGEAVGSNPTDRKKMGANGYSRSRKTATHCRTTSPGRIDTIRNFWNRCWRIDFNRLNRSRRNGILVWTPLLSAKRKLLS